jgi:hypothetical protein
MPAPIKNQKWHALANGSIGKNPLVYVIVANSRGSSNGGRHQGTARELYRRYGTARGASIGPAGGQDVNGGVLVGSGLPEATTYSTLPTQKTNIWWPSCGMVQKPAYIAAGSSSNPLQPFTANLKRISRQNLELITADRTFNSGTGSYVQQFDANAAPSRPDWQSAAISTNSASYQMVDRINRFLLPPCPNALGPTTAQGDLEYRIGGGSPTADGPLWINHVGVRDVAKRGGWWITATMIGGGLNTCQLADAMIYGGQSSDRQQFWRSLIAMVTGGNSDIRPTIILDCEFRVNTNTAYPGWSANGANVVHVNMSSANAGTIDFQGGVGTNYNGYKFQLLRGSFKDGPITDYTQTPATITSYNTANGAFTLSGNMPTTGNNFLASVSNVGSDNLTSFGLAYKAIVDTMLGDIQYVGGADALAVVTAGTEESGAPENVLLENSQDELESLFAGREDVCVLDTGAQLMDYTTEIVPLNAVADPQTGDSTHPNAGVFEEVKKRTLDLIGERKATTLVSGVSLGLPRIE